MSYERNCYPFHNQPRNVAEPITRQPARLTITVSHPVRIMGARAGYWASLIVTLIAWGAA